METHDYLSLMREGALYIRVSTHEQEELSPDAQKRLLLDYAKKNHINITSDHIYQDDGISGRKAEKRPMFQQMIAHAKSKEHPFDVILVWKFSRFARNQEESIVYKSMLRKINVDTISVTEPIMDGPFGPLIERIIEWMDEYYSINLSSEVKRGMTEKALRGGYQSTTPFGYDYQPGLVPSINKSEADTVRLIFDLYTSGSDFSSIARRLNTDGIVTKRGNLWELRTIQYILKNPFYTGKVRWNRAKHSAYQENPKDEIIIADGQHEAIISDAQFTQAAERMIKEFRPIKRKGSGYTKHWLSGVLKCRYCGSNMTYYKYKNLHGNFMCYKYSKGLHSEPSSISEDKITVLVLDGLKNVIDSGNIIFNYNVTPPKSNDALDKLNSLLEKISKKEKRIRIAYEDGIDSLEDYKENRNRLTLEREHILSEIDTLTSPNNIVDESILKDKMLKRCSNVYDILQSGVDIETKSSSLRNICESITYDKEKKKVNFVFYLS